MRFKRGPIDPLLKIVLEFKTQYGMDLHRKLSKQ